MLTLEDMLVNSVHIGHPIKKWNPKMQPFIYGERDGIHVIDILQTLICLEKVGKYLYESTRARKAFLFVSTKKQFRSLIEKSARVTNSYFVNKRWLGGMLTNWTTINSCVKNLKFLYFSIKQELEGSLNNINKRELLILKKRKARLEKFFSGIKDLEKTPDIVIIIGQKQEINVIKECRKLNIPIISLIDTNCDPSLAEYIIPANDDSILSVKIILNELCKSFLKGLIVKNFNKS
uniref:Small ribosomal subunit protein uS2c n=1 Tax=Phacus orbicularis TaxID=158829 RepID=A0A182B0X0_9EUGL|nr:ribosomal protein S2 [Phacus orbicularis]